MYSLGNVGTPATNGQIAANAVMAGCRPEYFPAVLALAPGHHGVGQRGRLPRKLGAAARVQRPHPPRARHQLQSRDVEHGPPGQRHHRPGGTSGSAQHRRRHTRPPVRRAVRDARAHGDGDGRARGRKPVGAVRRRRQRGNACSRPPAPCRSTTTRYRSESKSCCSSSAGASTTSAVTGSVRGRIRARYSCSPRSTRGPSPPKGGRRSASKMS